MFPENHFLYRCIALAALPLCLASCGSKTDLGKITEIKAKIQEVKLESDRLSTESRSVQEDIKATGSPEVNSQKALAAAQAQADAVKAEGANLEKLASALETAKSQLEKERAAFNQKYPVR